MLFDSPAQNRKRKRVETDRLGQAGSRCNR